MAGVKPDLCQMNILFDTRWLIKVIKFDNSLQQVKKNVNVLCRRPVTLLPEYAKQKSM